MIKESNGSTAAAKSDANFHRLIAISILLWIVYGAILWISPAFGLDEPTIRRPIPAILLLLAVAFVFYGLSIRIAVRATQSTKLIWLIVGTSVVFRVTVLFSTPVQEVDLYRYIWDGVVSAQGVSPFRYAPDQIEFADPIRSADPDVRKLARIRQIDPAIARVLQHVHFGELPTVYPPTSQFVFCGAALITPDNASFETRVRIMKLCLLGFDLGVLFLVIKLLSLCKLPVGLSVMYAWCPLVLKEVANSGHLDTIAVFLSMLAVYWFAKLLVSAANPTYCEDRKPGWRLCQLTMIAIALAAAVGAKLYPVVLAPLIFMFVAKRFGIRTAILPCLFFVIATVLILSPMMPRQTEARRPAMQNGADIGTSTQPKHDPSLGVKTFLKSWEMNDFIFLVLVENLKPAQPFPENKNVWFSVLPDGFRQSLVGFVSTRFSIPVLNTPFLITRIVTSLVFWVGVFWLAWRAGRQGDAQSFCQAAFLTLAWFWLLSPTQNPWYWLWALPLLPFVNNRAWIAVSGLVLVYYLRFWLGYEFADTAVLGTRYRGTDFFDFVVTWLEFGPWFVWLAVGFACRSANHKTSR